MITVTARLNEYDNILLENIAKKTDRKKSYLIRKAIHEFLEEQNDIIEANEILSLNLPTITLEELAKKYDLGN
jgi:predicted DNA-binding protein